MQRALLLVSLLIGAAAHAQTPAPVDGAAAAQPPRVLEFPPALYPSGHTDAATVSLRVKLSATGEVVETEVVLSAGADFDHAAQAAVLKWKFSPATRAGVPIPSRITIPFLFQPPPVVDAGPPTAPDAGVMPEDAGFAPPPDAGLPPEVTALPAAPAAAEAALPAGAEEVNVRGQMKKVDRGGSDFQITVGQLATIAGGSMEDLLQLAPGIFIANEGGAGHADQVFLRGFDAETGQGIEFTVNGVPINEVDNTDGHGYADTHFIIPELVKNLSVIEGPFDPHQGDFAEAGSVNYELGVTERRLQFSATYGSFGTSRALALWAPQGEREGTFAAVQAETSNGYGTSRAYTDASAMAQYEGELGQRGLWRALITAYSTHFNSAGVVRADDVANGTIGFYGTEDPSQGGSAQRYTASLSLENPLGDGVVTQQLFLTYRTLILDEDFTGFLLDQDLIGQTAHAQRGDGILQNYTALTMGGRGSYRITRNWFGQDQSLELGYYARFDHTTPSIDRVLYGTQIPYLVDEDMTTDVFNIAGYIDLDLHVGSRLTLRGGIRQEYFNYQINNLCAVPEGSFPTPANAAQYGVFPNTACESSNANGAPRLPNQETTAAGLVTEPKATVLYKINPQITASGSFGIGATSEDATQISQSELTPFTQIIASELGARYQRRFARGELSGRLVGFFTHVSQELVFNPDLGRLSPTGGTSREGGVAEVRYSGAWFDEMASATYAYATYDGDGTLVPYVPNLVARSDTVVFHSLPWRLLDHPILAKAGVGLNYVGERPLPLGQLASPTFVLDASAKLRWSFFELGIEGKNLLNSQYPLSEFFYASFFHQPSGGGPPYPTLAPTEAFTAAPPLTVLATLSFILDKESDR